MSVRAAAPLRTDSNDIADYAPILDSYASSTDRPKTSPTSTRPPNPTSKSARLVTKTKPSRIGAGRSDLAVREAKTNPNYDVIDRLDISGLYGGGAFHRHDGPYAAATARANKGPQAPMQAFDPNTLNHSAPPSSRPAGKGQLSARAQAAMAAMDNFDDPNSSTANLRRRNSDSSVRSITLGFPARRAATGKNNAQLTEAFGVRDNEAWQDYGRSYTPQQNGSYASSRESFAPEGAAGEGGGVSREDRMARATSVWDIEATLKAGKPVGAAPPPPMPVIPSEFSQSSIGSDGGPKRSKSLVSRFGRGRKGTKGEGDSLPNSPARPTISGPTPCAPPPLNRAQTDAPLSRSQRGSPTSPSTQFASGGSYPHFGAQASPTGEGVVLEGVGPKPVSPQGGTTVRFAGGPQLGSSRSEGAALNGGEEGRGQSQPMARKGSVLQRLFGKKSR